VRKRTAETISFTLDDFRRAASFPLTHTIAVPEGGETSPTAVQEPRGARLCACVRSGFAIRAIERITLPIVAFAGGSAGCASPSVPDRGGVL
jgi:hypothetical protein